MPIVTCPHCQKPVTLPEPWPDTGYVCPHCHNTAMLPVASAPQPLPLPAQPPANRTETSDDWDEPDDAPARSRRRRDASGGQGLIVLGYVAFVAIPIAIVIALAVWKFGQKRDDTAEATPTPAPAPIVKPDPAPPRKVTPKPQPERKQPESTTPEEKPEEGKQPELKPAEKPPEVRLPEKPPEKSPEPTPEVKPPEKTSEKTPERVPEIVAIALAPEPRVSRPDFRPPENSYQSDWQKAGGIEIRVAGVALTKVPILDPDGNPGTSPIQVLTIWLEVRTDKPNSKYVLTPWQHPAGDACSMTTNNPNVPVERGAIGRGAKVNTGLDYRQPILASAPPRLDVVVFSEPPDGATSVILRLDATRYGGSEEMKLRIPKSAW